MLKNQSGKQPIISKGKNPTFNNVSFRNLPDTKSIKVFNEINEQDKTFDYSRLDFIGSSNTFSFKNFMSLGNLTKNIYNGNASLDAAKQKQRRMEEVLENFINYNPVKDNYKNQEFNILPDIKEFYKGRREVHLGSLAKWLSVRLRTKWF